ncbi:MTH1187 family thiamine-binding protein [Effusibacillus consociatus]|uniref:MTH1187 family thiamine-binding protein n=1 Tax=Effusibacillus consociatus TaxID=1117041 RepID=A0ABV9PW15_9BACL
MPLLEISVVPVGTNTPSFSSCVTNSIRMLEQKGLKYQITPTATIIEGDLNQLLDMAKEIHQNAFTNGVDRVITNISIDHRTDKTMDMSRQVEVVQQSLQ